MRRRRRAAVRVRRGRQRQRLPRHVLGETAFANARRRYHADLPGVTASAAGGIRRAAVRRPVHLRGSSGMIYESGGATYSVSLQPLGDGMFRASVGERDYTVRATPVEGGWLLAFDGRQIRVYAAARGSERFVGIDGQAYTLNVPAAGRRRATGVGGGDLTAQMPGQVREVFVAAGDTVASGQALLLLEAMKMEIRISAPADGQVRRVLVQPGDVVDRGQRLVEMDQNSAEC
ncbi:MAG: biotin/lipoyl-binding protein [Anaerolineae bacterium]|nr:biotin/lipoyl-binding protein [Anaerolineae bacterium]